MFGDTAPVEVTHRGETVAGPGWDGAALPAGVSRLGSLTDAVEQIGAAVLR